MVAKSHIGPLLLPMNVYSSYAVLKPAFYPPLARRPRDFPVARRPLLASLPVRIDKLAELLACRNVLADLHGLLASTTILKPKKR